MQNTSALKYTAESVIYTAKIQSFIYLNFDFLRGLFSDV